jgi:N-carbamoyl-L-amino-acid hydrolase
MPDRRDAVIAASHLVIAVNEEVRREPGRQVGTVGQLNVVPNAPNVVPGLVRLTVELRDLSAEKILAIAAKIQDRARQIAAQTGTTIEFRPVANHDSSLATPEVQKSIETACGKLGLAFRHLPSGAGHDAQPMATLGPMGMIFVPSVNGVSHSPKELTPWDDCARGADVLLQTVLLRAA